MFNRHPSAGVNYIPNRHQPPPANQPFVPRTPPPAATQPPGAPAVEGPGATPPGQQYTPNQFAQTPTPTPPPGAGGTPPGLSGPPGAGAGPIVAQAPQPTGNKKRDRRLQEIFQMQNFINNRTPPGQTPLDLPDKYKKARKQFNQYMNSPQGALSGQIEAEMGGMINPKAGAVSPLMNQRIMAKRLRGGGGGGGFAPGGGDMLMNMQEF